MFEEKPKEYLSELIEESYGSSEELAKHLDMGIEMLFYLEEGTFEKRDVQNVVSAIRGIIRVLRYREESF
jgi:DNA-binding CsgD family transcriptional regulator